MRHLIWPVVVVVGITEAQQIRPPVSVGIVFAASGSMESKLPPAKQLAASFVQANLQDEFCLVQFNNEPNITSALTTDTSKIQGDLTSIQPRGGSALWDAVYLALNEVNKGRNARKALLVISDGGDNSSHYTEQEIANAVREAAVPIYSVGVSEPAPSRKERNGPTRLRLIADQSGGHYFAVANFDDIQDVVAKITAELRASTPR
jgi:Ca-activated chloride channel family protein